MFAVITAEKIQFSPGAVVRFPGSWQDYRALIQQLGDRWQNPTTTLIRIGTEKVNHIIQFKNVGFPASTQPTRGYYFRPNQEPGH